MIGKYRAWHKKYKKMYEVKGIMWGDYGDQDLCVYCVDEKGVTERFSDGLVVPMLYTGLPDCHGKEMCQGDIIIRGGNPKFKYEVVWSGERARFLLRSLFRRQGGDHGYIALSRNIHRNEIVGNIYEKSELAVNSKERAGTA